PFAEWVYLAITGRFAFTIETMREAASVAVQSMIDSGTVAVGDIANNSDVSQPLLEKANLWAVIFHEATGFQTAVAQEKFAEFSRKAWQPGTERVRHALAPHAPYSVSRPLFSEIRAFNRSGRLTTMHLAESRDEVEFIQTGDGPMRRMIEKLGRWDEAWEAPKTTPVKYAHTLGMLMPGMLAVHVVHADDDDIRQMKQYHISICTCPRSNLKIDVGGVAPIKKYIDAGINVCIGTDSLASNDDLDLWNEIHALRKLHPEVRPEELIRFATLNGAKALSLDNVIGTIEAGKADALIAVTTRQTAADPHDILTQGRTAIESVRHLSGHS
ncbi:MAG TPA: amidohydrolase family protein, partial [bacterium]|nr:amidohydrolase family protein [bacterium]